MNKTELTSKLNEKTKKDLIEIILKLNAGFPGIRQEIGNLVSPPKIDWEEMYDDCIDPVILVSTSTKINRLGVPSASLAKFTKFSPDREIAMNYMFESFEVLVKGLLFIPYRGSFNYSWVGGYGYECRKYMKKRKWLDSDADDKMIEIVANYFKPDSREYKEILMFSNINR